MASQMLYTQLYLNTLLLQDIASVLIGGYYSNKTFRNLTDNYLLGRQQDLKRKQNTDDVKTSDIPINFRPGLSDSHFEPWQYANTTNSIIPPNIPRKSPTPSTSSPNDLNLKLIYDEAFLNYDECYKFLEGRVGSINEETHARSYTIFSFYNTIVTLMYNLNLIKIIDSNTVSLNNLCIGDYILFCGTLEINTASNYINNLINILNAYGPTTLDTLFDNSSIGPITYSTMVKLLTTIQTELAKCGSLYTSIFSPKIKCLMSLSNTYISSGTLLYDSNHATIISFGKISNLIQTPNENITVFNKTGLSNYYNNLLISFLPYLQVLNDNGYTVPTEYISDLSGPAIQLIPVSIYI